MSANYKRYTDFLIELGIDKVEHTQKTFLGHLVNVWRLMEAEGCSEELCRAGMFHSIYGTERFQGFKLSLERRPEIAAPTIAFINTSGTSVVPGLEGICTSCRLDGEKKRASRLGPPPSPSRHTHSVDLRIACS